MPELPEVETIRLDLEQALLNDRLISFEVRDRRLMSVDDEKRWRRWAIGQPMTAFERHGKYLSIRLENGARLMFHLRMTGQLLLSDAPLTKHDRMALGFASGARLVFQDQRRFGEAKIFEPNAAWPLSGRLGPDALTEINQRDFVALLKKRTTRIQPLLMDQRLLAGVGNIYAQEALFRAMIRPSRPGNRIRTAEAEKLFAALQQILRDAIIHRGSTRRNYRDAHGQQGTAQTLHAVYQRGGKPCSRCGSALRASRVGGRGSVYCPQCQR